MTQTLPDISLIKTVVEQLERITLRRNGTTIFFDKFMKRGGWKWEYGLADAILKGDWNYPDHFWKILHVELGKYELWAKKILV